MSSQKLAPATTCSSWAFPHPEPSSVLLTRTDAHGPGCYLSLAVIASDSSPQVPAGARLSSI